MLRSALLTLLLSAPLAPAVEAAADARPEDTVRRVFATELAGAGPGLPSDEELAALHDALAPELLALLENARAQEARCVAAAPPDEKPALIEHHLFGGQHEAATAMDEVVDLGDGVRAEVRIALRHEDERFSRGDRRREVAWTVRASLRRVDGAWRIDDIDHGEGPTLVGQLEDYLAEDCGAAAPGP